MFAYTRQSHLRPTLWLQGILIVCAATLWSGHPARAACNDTPTIQNFSGGGRVTCPCFVRDERAGAVFTAPMTDYPIEILRVGIGWGSVFGGTPSSLENAIEIYGDGLPNPGSSIFTVDGPLLNDGAINQFDLEPEPGQILVNSGQFSVALRFLNDNAGDFFAPSVVHDGNGCQAGKNLVYAIPGGWQDACSLNIAGDWLFFVVYRACAATTDVGPVKIATNQPVFLLPVVPNPNRGRFTAEFVLANAGPVKLAVHDLSGRLIGMLEDRDFEPGMHRVDWDARDEHLSPGVYFLDLQSQGRRVRRTLVLTK